MLTLTSAFAGDVVIDNFDDPTEATLWTWENWSSEALTDFDSGNAGGGAAGSGSMKVINNFPDLPGGYSQAVVTLNFGANVDAETLYTNVSLDIKLDPSSYPRVDGVNYGSFEFIFRNGTAWDWNSLGSYELTAANTNWTHLNFPVKAPGNEVHHVTLKLGQNNLTNTVIYYVDNIHWQEAAGTIPPPTMFIEKTRPGLNLTAGTGGAYDRQNIKSVGTAFGWIGSSAPVSFALTITGFPNPAAYGGHQAHMYLVPGTPGTEASPDWNEANCIYVPIQENADGTGTANFRYKTNAPNSNGAATLDGKSFMYFNDSPTNGPVGALGSVTGAGILGTWKVTFNQDRNITLTAPDNTTTNLVMPAEDAALFAGDITVYFGTQPNSTANVGQTVILGGVKITSGETALLEDSFTTSPLNSDLWTVSAASATCVSLVTPSDPYWVSWTTPASGFVLQTNSVLNPSSWGDAGLTDSLLGIKRRALIPGSALPGTSQGFFRLNKPGQ